MTTGNDCGSEPRFLDEPRISYDTHDGVAISAYVRLADRKAARAVQPDARHPVYLDLDAEGWPVGMTLYGPVDCMLVVGLVWTLLSDADGKPAGVGQHVHCELVVMNRVLKVVSGAAREAAHAMEGASA